MFWTPYPCGVDVPCARLSDYALKDTRGGGKNRRLVRRKFGRSGGKKNSPKRTNFAVCAGGGGGEGGARRARPHARGAPPRREGGAEAGAFCHPERRARSARSRRTSPVADARSGGGISGLEGARRTAGARRLAKAPPRLRRRHERGDASCGKAAVKGRWARVPIGPAGYGSSTCGFAVRNLHKSPPQRARSRCARKLRRACGALWPAAIGAGFVRLAAGRARVRPAGARGLTGRRCPRPPGARSARTKKRDSCSKSAVWERVRGSRLRGSSDGGAVNWGNAQALRSGGRLRGEKPPPPAPKTPHFRSRSQFLNRNGRIWVQSRPPWRETPAGAGRGPRPPRAPPEREAALRGQNPPSL